MNVYYVVAGLVVLLAGLGISFLAYIRADTKDRRKHYKITLASGPDGALRVYCGKWTSMNREALTTVPGTDDMIADIDIRLIDGVACITDLRNRKVRNE